MADQANTALRMLISHLDYASGTRRLMDAKTPALQLGGSIPTVVTGDLNSTGFGPPAATPRLHLRLPAQTSSDRTASRLRWVDG